MTLRKLSKRIVAIVAVFGAAVAACNSIADQLARSEQHYQSARYEAALANLEDMEHELPHLGAAERVRYEYSRGMAHLRLEQRSDARHWLAIAREENRAAPGALTDDAVAIVERALVELDPLAPRNATSGGDASAATSDAAN